MRTIRTKVYQFSELKTKAAKQKAIESCSDYNVSYDWWESVYEDSKNIGLKLTGFDFDSASFVRQLTGEFTLAANEVAANITLNHGEQCNTYKAAELFMKEWEPVFSEYMTEPDNMTELETKLMDIEENFLTNILEDYRIILQKEYKYLTSEEAILETIQANEYEFTKDGKRF